MLGDTFGDFFAGVPGFEALFFALAGLLGDTFGDFFAGVPGFEVLLFGVRVLRGVFSSDLGPGDVAVVKMEATECLLGNCETLSSFFGEGVMADDFLLRPFAFVTFGDDLVRPLGLPFPAI